jgi:hypothetical protein
MISIYAVKSPVGHLALKSPYNAEVVDRLKRIGAKWTQTTWVFDARHEDDVRALCARYYGTDGLSLPDCVDLRITQPHEAIDDGPADDNHPTDWDWTRKELLLQGRRLIHPMSCQHYSGNARLEAGASLREGRIYNSKQHGMCWTPYVMDVLDVPRVLATELKEKHPQYVEIIDRESPTSQAGLLAQSRRLSAQIAALEQSLNSVRREAEKIEILLRMAA